PHARTGPVEQPPYTTGATVRLPRGWWGETSASSDRRSAGGIAVPGGAACAGGAAHTATRPDRRAHLHQLGGYPRVRPLRAGGGVGGAAADGLAARLRGPGPDGGGPRPREGGRGARLRSRLSPPGPGRQRAGLLELV